MSDTGDRSRAIGALLWKDPERILETAAALRESNATIECRLGGGSMGAAIPRGSTLRIRLSLETSYRIGEIVAFADESGLCVHRVVYIGSGKRADGYLITQGDACYYPDPPVHSTRVLGRVTEFCHSGSWKATTMQPSPDHAVSRVGRTLKSVIAALLEWNVRPARIAARALRIRKEHGVTLDPEGFATRISAAKSGPSDSAHRCAEDPRAN
jgi:hypothetical protein